MQLGQRQQQSETVLSRALFEVVRYACEREIVGADMNHEWRVEL